MEKMTDNELKELVASLAVQGRETDRRMQETDRRMQETDRRMQETDRQIKQVNKQIGEIGNKWGTFAEGMAIESIKKILAEKFQADTVSERTMRRIANETFEMDAFGYSNGATNTAVVVEIKSHLREDSVEQIEEMLTNFPKFFPDYADKKLFGLVACVHAPESLKNVLFRKGIYLALLSNDTFKLSNAANFKPKNFNPNAA